jgi:hypothetical protein
MDVDHVLINPMSHTCAPLSLQRLSTLFALADFPWWVAGGYAIELAVGRPFRDHEDMDVLVLRRDQAAVRRLLGDWDCRPVDPEGFMRRWEPNEELPHHVHDVWCREGTDAPWRFGLMLDDAEGDTWCSRRDSTVRKPLADLTMRQPGMPPFLAPDVQLYYKAKGIRPKDEQDLEMALPVLTPRQRTWLAEAVYRTYGAAHPWLARIES